MSKQKTIERDTNSSTTTRRTTRTSQPPSWSELADKANIKSGSSKIATTTAGALVGSLLLPIGLLPAIFASTLILATVGRSDMKIGASTGVGAAVISTIFLSGLSGFVSSIFIIPLLLPALLGLLAGVAGTYLGEKVNDYAT